MARRYNSGIVLLLQVGVLFFAWSPATNGLSLDDRLQLQKLTENYSDNKIKEMSAVKDAQLEELKSTVIELKVKVNRLEETVQRQETQIKELQKEKTLTELVPSHLALNDRPEKAVSFPRTCRELRATDPSLSSGMYWVDPDGQSIGDNPIYVYCDMIKGSTSIVHDSESTMDVGHCADPGCYSRTVNYNATMKQMIALADLSAECHQQIQYDCNYAPLQFGDISYAWWNDRNGTAQYFWSGGNSSVHTCQCGIDKNCVDVSQTCNCDSAAPVQLTDRGVISDKSFLPITRLNFGRTQLASSSGIHTLGRLECTGQASVVGMPKSCVDLWQIGHSLSGLYSVMGTEQVETVYCDFSKLLTDQSFQKWIGYNDVKSLPVYFYVQRNSSAFNTTGTPIPFDFAKLNIGNAMDLASGKFTAPRSGTYSFAFTGMAYFPASSSLLEILVGMYSNGNRIGSGWVRNDATPAIQYNTFSFQSTLSLEKGDHIWLQIDIWASGVYLIENSIYHWNHFSGWLHEETISKSLNVM